jgi:hypothetical protein
VELGGETAERFERDPVKDPDASGNTRDGQSDPNLHVSPEQDDGDNARPGIELSVGKHNSGKK